MPKSYRELTRFLRDLGTDEVEHSGQTFLGHLISVYRDLQKWGCDEPVCLAGMFHSIYGTEKFRRFALPLERRAEVRELIGTRAELIAYWNCVMDRPSFDQSAKQSSAPYHIRSRVTDESFKLSEEDFTDLCTLHLCDWLEQVPRSQQWDYRRHVYRMLAERLGGIALENYDRVFALETTTAADTSA